MTALSADAIVTYAARSNMRVIVTEQMVLRAVSTLGEHFTCIEIVEAIGRSHDPLGMTVSEYLVSLWIDNLVERGILARLLIGKGARSHTYTRGSEMVRYLAERADPPPAPAMPAFDPGVVKLAKDWLAHEAMFGEECLTLARAIVEMDRQLKGIKV